MTCDERRTHFSKAGEGIDASHTMAAAAVLLLVAGFSVVLSVASARSYVVLKSKESNYLLASSVPCL